MRRRQRWGRVAAFLLLILGTATPAWAQSGTLYGQEPEIRIGLRYGSSTVAAVTLTPQNAQDTLTLEAGGVPIYSFSDTEYLRVEGYRVLVDTVTSGATAFQEVGSLRAQGWPSYFEKLTLAGQARYLVEVGPYLSLSAAEGAQSRLGEGSLLGPDGALVGGPYATLSAAAQAAQSLLSQGTVAYPLFANGAWQVLVGQAATPQAASQLAASFSGARAYLAAGTEAQVVAGDGTVVGLVAAPEIACTGSTGVVGFGKTLYRGEILVSRQGGGYFTVINRLPLEDYLYGVVPSEMPASWHMAALEAQAVAARTYALSHMGEHAAQGFDLTATTWDQAYGGYSVENPRTDAAVNDTYGLILTYHGQPIDAFYEADSGGYTENSENVFDQYLPYIRGVPEPPGYVPHTWSVNFTPSQLESLVAAQGDPIGPVISMRVIGRGVSGRALSLVLTGTSGTYTSEKDAIRGLLGLDSTLFRITSDAQVYMEGAGQSPVSSAGAAGLYVVSASGQTSPLQPEATTASGQQGYVVQGAGGSQAVLPYAATWYTLNGKGIGHGLGMTQDGAELLAERGYTYAQILDYYYTGVQLTRAY